ncbi:UNVERIFIED_CONTAM: hypothetical protein FKN15_067371 [Acipenser sinensis]
MPASHRPGMPSSHRLGMPAHHRPGMPVTFAADLRGFAGVGGASISTDSTATGSIAAARIGSAGAASLRPANTSADSLAVGSISAASGATGGASLGVVSMSADRLSISSFSAARTAPAELQSSSCGNPGVPPKGILYGMKFDVGDTIRYSCVTGYVLDGHNQLTCITNTASAAVWDFPVPICRGTPTGVPTRVLATRITSPRSVKPRTWVGSDPPQDVGRHSLTQVERNKMDDGCLPTMQPPQSYSIGGQRSSGQLTGTV